MADTNVMGDLAYGSVEGAASDDALHALGAQRRNWRRVLTAISFSCVLDSLLLVGFACAGTVTIIVPIAYAATSLGCCAGFYMLIARLPRERLIGAYLTLPMVVASSVSELLGIWLAPQIAFYFLMVVFIVFGFGSMNLSIRKGALSWIAVVLAVALLLDGNRQPSWIPQTSGTERLLVWVCFVTTLGRCMLLGLFGRLIRRRLQQRGRMLNESVETGEKSLELVNAELLHQAAHDALTGLPNRTQFSDGLAKALHQGRAFAICVLDLDRFKVINDSLGHGAGDTLLRSVAERLISSTRSADVVARAGGDEFLLLLHDVSGREDIEKLAARWMNALAEPYRLDGTDLHVSASIGIARYPVDATNGQDLLARADAAMYHAKHNGRNVFRFFDAEVTSFSRERLVLEAELRQAVANSQLYLHYQPRVEVSTGEVRSVEALLRWEHPSRGRVMPGEFIPIAEDTGLILPIGEWVIREACRQARQWQVQGMPFLRVAVNVSPMQFRQPDFCSVVRKALAAHSLDPACLEIELTEATLMTNAEKSVGMLRQLSELGVVIAIDDFGTGYSSMSYLQRFPIDILKIDRSFICEITSNPNDVSIVRAIISLAHGLRLEVVAEGVESAAQLAILEQMGCDEYQGFLHSAAVAPEVIKSLLAPVAGRSMAAEDDSAERAHDKHARVSSSKW
ncbi:MAG: diguanylate cyclase [Gammaproteobacteria bacterium]|jgi:diguanylate cyclase (GGDEF)-like protein|nr:diguanylate cyclase [Gammaproteobacteria bacterium]